MSLSCQVVDSTKKYNTELPCSWTLGVSASLNFLPSATKLPFHRREKSKTFWKRCVALFRCSKLFDYYLKLKKATACESESPRLSLLHCISRAPKTQKSQATDLWARFAGLEIATWNSSSGNSCFWFPGLAGFDPSPFHSHLRNTKNTER